MYLLTLHSLFCPNRSYVLGNYICFTTKEVMLPAISYFVIQNERSNLHYSSHFFQEGLVIFRTQLTNRNSCLPHFAFAQLTKFFVQLLTIIRLRIAVDRDLSLVIAFYVRLQFLDNRLDCVVERTHPVQSATLGGSRAVRVHPVHTILGE